MLRKMKSVWKAVLAVVILVVVGTSHIVDVRAQENPPILPAETAWIDFSGAVTVNGETPTHSGLTITARIGDVYESQPVTVRVSPTGSFRYERLLVNPPDHLDLIGSPVEFWIDGEVKSTVTNWYAILQPCTDSNSLCPMSDSWGIAGIIRELDLDFPNLPGPDIRELRVGGFELPRGFVVMVMLVGCGFLMVGYFVFGRGVRGSFREYAE